MEMRLVDTYEEGETIAALTQFTARFAQDAEQHRAFTNESWSRKAPSLPSDRRMGPPPISYRAAGLSEFKVYEIRTTVAR